MTESIAHYRIVSKLGEGGMGAVYRATDTKLNRDVAIKVLPDTFAQDPDRMTRFAREAQVLASLNHPNIAAIHGVEERAIVMELVEGETLSGPRSVEEALPIIHQLIDALEYAHEKGIVHRDLKPANIKVTPEGRVKVLDFGLAKAMSGDAPSGDPASSPTLTMRATIAGVIMGTAAYMSPEQARGQSVDKRADIWAFGAVVYELVTGRPLFEAPTVSDTLAAVLTREPSFDAVPPRLVRLLRLCLGRDPRQRLRDISGARLLLEESPAAAVKPRRPLPWIAAAVVLAAALAVVSAIHFRETLPPPVVTRFQIAPPEGSVSSSWLALSPDGRQLAFRAEGKEGPLLWVRPLDSFQARALPGTENALVPAWSPDGRSLAFAAGGKLKRIDLAGGTPQTVANSKVVRGTHWSRDGFIYFGGSVLNESGNSIVRVPQAGGDPTPVTRVDASLKEFMHVAPWVLPDGRGLFYSVNEVTREDFGFWFSSMDGKQKKRIVALANGPARFAPPVGNSGTAHVVFVREDTLMAQPVDFRTFDLSGETFPVAERLASGVGISNFAISDTGILAYVSGGARNGRLTWFDRSGKLLGMLGPPAPYNNVALSPDGSRVVAAQGSDQNRNLDLWLIDVARGIPTRFTFDAAQDWDPVWSPDGSRIAFSSSRDRALNMYLKDSNGARNEEPLDKASLLERPCDWSRDGRFLMYTKGGENNTTGLWTLTDPAGDPANRKASAYLTGPFSTTQCQFSPEPGGPHWVAYLSDESRQTSEIFVQSFPAGAGKFQISSKGGSQPRWRRDGKELFYIGPDGKLMAVEIRTSPRFEAGIPQALFDTNIAPGTTKFVFRYDVAADGKRFLVITSSPEQAYAALINVVFNWQSGSTR